MSDTPAQAIQHIQSLSMADVASILRNAMHRIDADGNTEAGVLEYLSCIAANTAAPGIVPRTVLRTAAAAVTNRGLAKSQPGAMITVYDIWSYADAATTITFTDDRGVSVLPAIYHSAASTIQITSYRGLSLPSGKSLLYSTSGNTTHLMVSLSVIESSEHADITM